MNGPVRPLIRLGVTVLAVVAASLTACNNVRGELPTYKVTRGEFHVTQVESGEIQAASGEVIMSPRIGGSLKILYLYPEGQQVDIGDLILQFDASDFEKEMMDREGQLESAIMDYQKTKVESELKTADLQRAIEQQQAELQLAQLNLDRTRLESPIEQEQARIQLDKARRSLHEARQDSIAQEVVNRVDLMALQGRINRLRQRYEEARRDYERTSVHATRPGIVVYRRIWKRGAERQTKVAVGDDVWGGRALLDIPDLSDMQVWCLIGEMDLKRMAVGQKTLIRLDAFPGPVFHGQVLSLAPMASPQPGAPDIRVFEMLVEIEAQDPRLRPGMSAKVEVILESLSGVVSVPLAAVHRRDGRDIVYRLDGGSVTPVEVELGVRNNTAVVVHSGLEAGDVISLEAPQRR